MTNLQKILLTIVLPVFIDASDINSTINTLNSEPTKSSLFYSQEDGKFDVSAFLSQKYGFMPIPIVVTEPAVGYGGGLNLMFLHDSLSSALKRKSPPSISGVVAVGTENGTKIGGAYHIGFWKEDTIRTTSVVGLMDINMDFYIRDTGLDMNLNGFTAYQELLFRVSESNFFLGGNYLYIDLESTRNDETLPFLNPLLVQHFKMGALAAVAQYDTRDSIFTPSNGLFSKVSLRRFDETFGGDENFWRYSAKAFYFKPLTDKLVLGLRVEGEMVDPDDNVRIPYMMNPAINLRGIPSMRYQGEKMLMSEVQLRWEFEPRWNLVAFGGVGKVYGDEYNFRPEVGLIQEEVTFDDAKTHVAGGIGFRYELARKFGLWGGLDLATNEENDLAVYITIGSAWGTF